MPIISTQLVTDTMGDGDTLAPLLGATAVGLQCGHCLLHDHQGRIEAVQVDVASERLLGGLSTTPGAAARS